LCRHDRVGALAEHLLHQRLLQPEPLRLGDVRRQLHVERVEQGVGAEPVLLVLLVLPRPGLPHLTQHLQKQHRLELARQLGELLAFFGFRRT
jgi:hypothetical protein